METETGKEREIAKERDVDKEKGKKKVLEAETRKEGERGGIEREKLRDR